MASPTGKDLIDFSNALNTPQQHELIRGAIEHNTRVVLKENKLAKTTVEGRREFTLGTFKDNRDCDLAEEEVEEMNKGSYFPMTLKPDLWGLRWSVERQPRFFNWRGCVVKVSW